MQTPDTNVVATTLPMTTTNVQLRPYQQEGVEWLLAQRKAILADEEGLGKTPQAAVAMAHHLPALVVARSYLLPQWLEELHRFLPDADIRMPRGTREHIRNELLANTPTNSITLVSYDTLRNMPVPPVETVVIDEAHNIRRRDSAQSERAIRLCHATPRVYLLTATPYYRADEDIYNLLHAIAPDTHGSYWTFVKQWFSANWSAPYAPKLYGIPNRRREEWRIYVQQYMLKRTYQDVGRFLPPIIERTIPFDLPQPLRSAYDEARNHWRINGEPIEDVGTLLTTLRDLTMCAPKLEVVDSIVGQAIEQKQPTLIYTWYREHAYVIARKLESAIVISGDTPIQARHDILAMHKDTAQITPIVATIESLSEGVNLEHIKHVIYAEETYVRGKHRQSMRRAQRDRGTSTDTTPVNVYYIRAKRTIDEHIPVVRMSRGKADEIQQLAKMIAHTK